MHSDYVLKLPGSQVDLQVMGNFRDGKPFGFHLEQSLDTGYLLLVQDHGNRS